MRNARANDYWRHVMDSDRKRPLRLRSLSFQDVIGLGSGRVELHHALTIICGANGVGKSTMLSVCGLTLNFELAEVKARNRFSKIQATFELSTSPDHSNIHALKISSGSKSSPSGLDFDFQYIDVGWELFRIRTLVDNESNWDELLEQHGARDLKQSELDCLRRLTCKTYTSCKLYEIDEYPEGFSGPFPYFIVTCDGAEYAMEEMGTGEGSLFLIWWKLSHARSPGILLIEEPETHITPQSQRAMMDLIAEKCDKSINCIVTTHSPDVISHVPSECIRLLMRHNNTVRVVNSPDESQLHLLLGVEVQKSVILIVEDRCAYVVAQELLRLFRADIISRVHVAIGGSDSEVLGALRHFPTSIPGPKLVGVLDGDMKHKYDLTNLAPVFTPAGMKHPLEFLPWSVSPDAFLRGFCCNMAHEIARDLSVSEEQITTVLSSIEGYEQHDWIDEFGKRAHVSFETIVRTLLHIVLTDPEQHKECESFVNRIAHHAMA